MARPHPQPSEDPFSGPAPDFDERAQIWLTLGEAADAADVSHRQLAAWMAAETLDVRTGWREGAEIRLVRLGDLEALCPELHLDRIRVSLDERGVFTGPRRAFLGKGRAAAAGADSSEIEPTPVAEADREWAAELEREVARLRSVITTLRSEHEALESHLDRRVSVVREHKLQRTSDVVPAAQPVAAASHGPQPVALAAPKNQWAAGAALVAGAALGAIAAAGLVSPRSALASERTQAAVLPTLAGVPSVSPTPSIAEAASEGATSVVSRVTPAAPSDLSAATQFAVSLAAVSIRHGLVGATFSGPAPVGDAPVSDSTPWDPISLATVDPLSFTLGSDFAEPCAYSQLLATRPSAGEPSALLTYGPCFGPARPSDGLVAGRHRVDRLPCCRHHAFVERMTSATRVTAAAEGILEEARASLADGTLPPLLRLRADRSATRFLRADVKEWESAGFDAIPGSTYGAEDGPHDWSLLGESSGQGGTSGEVRVQLESWVRTHDPLRSGSVDMRRFRMVLRLQAARDGDVLEALEWLTD